MNVVFVCMASPEVAEAFRVKAQAPQAFICDPDRKLYEAFSLRRATLGQVFAPKVILRSFVAARHGAGRPESDPMQLGGAFVIDQSGEVVWSQRQRDVSDNASASAIAEALDDANSGEGSSGVPKMMGQAE